MKAKEYFQKYIEPLALDVSRAIFYNVTEDCFRDFVAEQATVAKSVKSVESKITKIREFVKKWESLGNMVGVKFTDVPNTNNGDTSIEGSIDLVDVVVFKELYMSWLEKYHPEVFKLVSAVKADRSRLPSESRQRAYAAGDDKDFSNLLALSRRILNRSNQAAF